MTHPFLSAEWKKLLVINYEVDNSVLEKYLPAHTEIDTWNNKCFISLVGFMFINTKLKGIGIPFHRNFEEINLRFYVRHKEKRGVVFIKEIVPKPALTFVANTFYKEHYQTMHTLHQWHEEEDNLFVQYGWEKRKSLNIAEANASLSSKEIQSQSEEEFILEHYWGYAKVNDRATTEYEVKHPKWQIHSVKNSRIDVDFEKTYGKDFSFLNRSSPASVFLAEGSEIQVMQKNTIRM